MRNVKQRILSLLLAALLLMSATLPASAATASTIRLTKTTGTVSVTNASGRSVSTWANMLLYSGYSVHTRSGSYAWISLDSSKLSKLDAASKAQVRKSGSKLELLLNYGHLYFNVTSPVTSGQTFNIKTSTMAVGVRGTCGWVKEIDEYTSELYLLEGTVQISSPDPATGQAKTTTVNAGEKAVATVRPQGTEIIREQFTVEDIDEFVMDELIQNPTLCQDIYDASGLDILGINRPEMIPEDAAYYNGHYYKIYSTRLSWSDAKAQCESLGGHLLTITSQEEQDFIEALNSSSRSLWIGAYRDNDLNWRWVTNEEWSYTHWGEGEPNNSSNVISNENCVAIWPRTWNDLNNNSSEQSGFICEWG